MVVTGTSDFIYAGNRRQLLFTVLDQDAGGSTPFDLTGFSVTWAMAILSDGVPVTSGPLINISTSTSAVVITNAAGGLLTVTLDGTLTAAIVPATYYWELEVTSAAGNSTVVATGTMDVRPNVDNT